MNDDEPLGCEINVIMHTQTTMPLRWVYNVEKLLCRYYEHIHQSLERIKWLSFMWKSEDSFEIFGVVKLMQPAIPTF